VGCSRTWAFEEEWTRGEQVREQRRVYGPLVGVLWSGTNLITTERGERTKYEKIMSKELA
jgi:hypothetical protein